jgi:hypothetical protein
VSLCIFVRDIGIWLSKIDWNWFLDSKDAGGNFTNSPLWDPVSGFGGNGKKEKAPDVGGLGGFFLGLFGLGGTGGGCISMELPCFLFDMTTDDNSS